MPTALHFIQHAISKEKESKGVEDEENKHEKNSFYIVHNIHIIKIWKKEILFKWKIIKLLLNKFQTKKFFKNILKKKEITI